MKAVLLADKQRMQTTEMMQRVLTVVPVSYTHLDVYKRQLKLIVGFWALWLVAPCYTSWNHHAFPTTIVSPSKCHYIRSPRKCHSEQVTQLQHKQISRKALQMNRTDSIVGTKHCSLVILNWHAAQPDSHVPVLDVYKRQIIGLYIGYFTVTCSLNKYNLLILERI